MANFPTPPKVSCKSVTIAMILSSQADFSYSAPMVTLNGKGVLDMKLFCKDLWQDTQGQDLVEYALMVGMVAVAAVAAMPALSTSISKVFSKVTSTLTSAAG